MTDEKDMESAVIRHQLRVLWIWLTGGWRWFRLGRCQWCARVELIMPGEILCEDCWLDSK
jgi:hypothetical protein